MFVRLEVIVCVYKAGMGRYVIKVVTSFLLQLEMYTAQIMHCSRLLKTGCNNVVGATLFLVFDNIVQRCYS